MEIFLDLDEVLADFAGAALERHGLTADSPEIVQADGEWDLAGILRISQSAFWAPLKGEGFWLELSPLPWAIELLRWVRARTGLWWIISKTPPYSTAWSEKQRWVYLHLGAAAASRLILIGGKVSKGALASGSALLLDDSPSNLEEFRLAGGRAIMFPSLRNRLWTLLRGYSPEQQKEHVMTYLQDSLVFPASLSSTGV